MMLECGNSPLRLVYWSIDMLWTASCEKYKAFPKSTLLHTTHDQLHVRLTLSIQNFGLSMHPGQPNKSPDNQKIWCSCPTDNHKFWRPSCETQAQPCMDNQKLGRTIRNCNLVVCGTTIYFSLIRTLLTLYTEWRILMDKTCSMHIKLKSITITCVALFHCRPFTKEVRSWASSKRERRRWWPTPRTSAKPPTN